MKRIWGPADFQGPVSKTSLGHSPDGEGPEAEALGAPSRVGHLHKVPLCAVALPTTLSGSGAQVNTRISAHAVAALLHSPICLFAGPAGTKQAPGHYPPGSISPTQGRALCVVLVGWLGDGRDLDWAPPA